MVANCSSRFAPRPTLPGLIRYLSSVRAHSGCSASSLCPLKWKSPTSGTSHPMASRRSRMRGTCAAASAVFTVTRTISEPARASSATCFAVASASAVSVLVIDWTRIGAPPPMSALPTRTCRVVCLAMTVMALSFQREPGDLDLDVGLQIDGLVVVDQAHVRRVADHQRQRRLSGDHPAAACRVQLRHQHLPVSVLDLDPGLARELHAYPAFSTRGLGLELRARLRRG